MHDLLNSQPIFGKVRHLHLVGIGGIGMSSIAEVLLEWGFRISGSDMQASEITADLEDRGATIYIGHQAENIAGADVVVHTSAVDPQKNAETAAAVARGIPVINRAAMLGALTQRRFGVGIAGTHGKTTTTTLTGHVVRAARLDPTIIVGGRVHGFEQRNAVAGKGDIIIVEADEFDRTFLKLHPSLAVITNIEWEHVDIYEDLDDTRRAFVEFANKIPFYGAVIACIDDEEVRTILPELTPRVVSYGLNPEADLCAVQIVDEGFYSRFEVLHHGELLGEISVKAPGAHNVRNALAAIGVGLELRIPFEQIASGLASYSGVYRRFYQRGEVDGVLVVDDYAHHPTEVMATLVAARRGFSERRLVAVFQPHLFSRTMKFYRQFAEALTGADQVVLTDIYPSREEPVDGVTGEMIVDEMLALGHSDVHYVPMKEQLTDFLSELVQPGDLVLTMGAGDISAIGQRFVEELMRKNDR